VAHPLAEALNAFSWFGAAPLSPDGQQFLQQWQLSLLKGFFSAATAEVVLTAQRLPPHPVLLLLLWLGGRGLCAGAVFYCCCCCCCCSQRELLLSHKRVQWLVAMRCSCCYSSGMHGCSMRSHLLPTCTMCYDQLHVTSKHSQPLHVRSEISRSLEHSDV